eukprot:TRINITY_DN82228_c0_g1_i1.p1 TRINITY_DN82228_c0_g1~~TRINITY_DN82228_c0_g1_i1.p1  ORF type:complete len:484 (+),score=132.14 TRINITY_DN82228_c0_g1_i1:160-1611(+)
MFSRIHHAQSKVFVRCIRSMPPFGYKPPPYKGKSFEEIMKVRGEHVFPMVTYYKNPVMITDGKMQYLWDEKGKRYLDMIGGIVTVSVGHCHPHVVEAATKQMEKLQHTTSIYVYPEIEEYADMLQSRLPKGLDCCFFANSGSEANDLAMLVARMHTGNHTILGLKNGYHGVSPTAMGLTALHTWKFPLPQGGNIQHVMAPDPYRGLFGGHRMDTDGKVSEFIPGPCLPKETDDLKAADLYAADVRATIDGSTSGGVAAFFSEYIQGVGGTMQQTQGYLERAYKMVRAAGGLCVSDEVQCGFGRLGHTFWGFETQGVVPDMVTMAKGMGNGFPMAGVVTSKEIAQVMRKRLHFNTFGGNPVACAVGKAVLEVIDEEKLQERAKTVGKYFGQRLMDLQKKHEVIGDVRGMGFMWGVELVKDRKTKEPANDLCADVFELAKDHGVLLGKGGLKGNVFRIKPPMCITKDDADFVIDVMDHCLKEFNH